VNLESWWVRLDMVKVFRKPLINLSLLNFDLCHVLLFALLCFLTELWFEFRVDQGLSIDT
jgi:hypothetical protein